MFAFGKRNSFTLTLQAWEERSQFQDYRTIFTTLDFSVPSIPAELCVRGMLVVEFHLKKMPLAALMDKL